MVARRPIIIVGSAEPIFAIFSPNESVLGADDRPVPRFPICQGKLPWQQNNVGRSNERRLILPAFFALVFENKLEYHYLYVRINSIDDQAISCINLVGFRPVPQEFTRINCVHGVDQRSG